MSAPADAVKRLSRGLGVSVAQKQKTAKGCSELEAHQANLRVVAALVFLAAVVFDDAIAAAAVATMLPDSVQLVASQEGGHHTAEHVADEVGRP